MITQSDIGRKVIVTDPVHKETYGKEFFLLFISPFGFLCLSTAMDKGIADGGYYGQGQVELVGTVSDEQYE